MNDRNYAKCALYAKKKENRCEAGIKEMLADKTSVYKLKWKMLLKQRCRQKSK